MAIVSKDGGVLTGARGRKQERGAQYESSGPVPRRDAPGWGGGTYPQKLVSPAFPWEIRPQMTVMGNPAPVLPKGRHVLCGLSSQTEGT